MENFPISDTLSFLKTWHRRLRISEFTHYESSKPLSKLSYMLGVPVVILTAAVGTSVFATLEKEIIEPKYKILIGLISVLAAILSALQTFLRFEERAEKHRIIAGRCAALRREIEQFVVRLNKREEIPEPEITQLREKYDKITEDAPSTSERLYNKAKKIVSEQDRSE